MEENDIIETSKKERSLLWVSPISAGMILTLVFKAAHRFPGDTHIFLNGDYLVQFMEYIVMFWRKLLTGNGLFYSFDIGLGAATWEHYSFYGFSPFNFVFLLIKDSDTAAFVLLLLKVCAIAITMHLFLVYGLKVKENIVVLFSVSYALCAYVINFHFCIIFLDYLYILPIVMLMVIRFVETGKVGGLTAAYAYSFLTAYYGGYMIGIFSFVCFLLMLISGVYRINKKKLFLRYILCVIVAVLISAVITLPTAVAILLGGSGESGQNRNLNISLWDVLADLYPLRSITIKTLQPSIYCGLPALMFTFGYFFDKEISLRKKISCLVLLLFLVICTFFKPAYIMMHGFDEPDDYYFRFSFLYCFYFVSVGSKWAEKKHGSFRILPIAITFLGLVLITAIDCITSGTDEREQLLAIAAVISFLLVLYYIALKLGQKGGTVVMCIILFVEMFANSYFSITPDTTALIRWKESYDLWNYHGKEALNTIRAYEEKEGTGQFYRVCFRDGIWTNDSMYFGYHGLGYFSSMEQRDTRRLMNDLGYATCNRLVVDKGGSPFTEMIFAQKYKVLTDPDVTDEGCENVEVEKNECVLPIAYMVDEDIINVQMVNDAFENQQSVMDAMLGRKKTIWERYIGDVDIEFENASITKYDDMYYIEKKEPGTGIIIFSIESDEEKECYAYISRREQAVDPKSPVVFSDFESALTGLVIPSYMFMPSLVNLGKGINTRYLYVTLGKDSYEGVDIENYCFASFNKEGLQKAHEELKPGGLNVIEMKDDNIRGHIRVSSDKIIMYTSIPYDKNWHIKSDGKEMDTFSILNGAFLACRLPEGEHEIQIYYDNKYIKFGSYISIIGVFVLAAVFLMQRRMSGCKRVVGGEEVDEQ